MTSEEVEQNKQQEDTMRNRFLTFSVSKEVFGIEIRYVTEIIGIQPINVLPEVPEYIKGIINLRGKIIPVVDMRLRFKKEAIDYTDRTCIVVVETSQFSAGLIVDQVAEVLTIEQVVPPPAFQTGITNQYISGIGKVNDEVKLLLDCERLFDGEMTKMLNHVAQNNN